MAPANRDGCAAWHLLVEFLLSQRTHLPNLAAALRGWMGAGRGRAVQVTTASATSPTSAG